VIIPNWNGRRFLPDCLGALRRQTYADFEVVLVDNASTDDSVAYARAHFPEVRVLVQPRNLGFSGGVNAGIRAGTSEIVVLLNNDTEAEPGWLAALVAALDAHPEAGMAASKLLLFGRRDVLHSAGDFYTAAGMPGNRGVWQRDDGQFDSETRVFGACGGAAAYRRALLNRIGLFDEDFGSYCEDVDLAFRAQLAGQGCVFVPAARVYHHLSATGGGPLASYYTGRNFIAVIAKNMPGPLLRRNWWRILRAQLRLALESLRHWREPAARARLRGQLAGLWLIPRLLEKRRTVMATCRVGPEQLQTLFAHAG
jgi:GT2 family glycosyltransferase